MPRWNFEVMSGTLSKEDKDHIAKQVTKIYTDLGFPAFWINVFFHENDAGAFYSGGKTTAKAAFFAITHAARQFRSEEERTKFHTRIDEIVRPVFEPKDIKWEYNIYIYPGENWRINGMVPPASKPDMLKQWVDEDRAVPF